MDQIVYIITIEIYNESILQPNTSAERKIDPRQDQDPVVTIAWFHVFTQPEKDSDTMC